MRPERSEPEPLASGSSDIADAAIDVAGIGAWEWDASTKEARWRGPWKRILGLAPDQPSIAPGEFLAWVPSSDQHVLERVGRSLEQGEPVDAYFRIRRPDGEVRWLWIRGRRTEEQDRLRMIGVIEDITERARIRMRLDRRDQELRLLTEHALDVIVRTDLERRTLYISNSCERLFGYTPEEVKALDTIAQFHPDDVERINRSFLEILSEPGYSTETFRVRRKDGSYVWVESLGHAIRDTPGGEIREVLFVMRDATRRMDAEAQERQARAELEGARERLEAEVAQRTRDLRETHAQLVRSEQMLRSIVENAAVFIQTVDRSGRVLTANRAGADGSMVGKSVFDWVDPADHPRLERVLERVFEEREVVDFEMESPGRGWFDAHYAPIVEDGRATAAVVVTSDITARRRAEDEIRQSEALFRELADSTPIMLWHLSENGIPVWENRATREFLGRDTEPRRDLIHPDDVERFVPVVEEKVGRREPFDFEIRIRRFDGAYRSCFVGALPRQAPDGSFAGYVGSCIDVTELRDAEALATARREQLAHSLRVESLDQMRLGLAHELHQPLAAISAATGAALRGLVTDAIDVPRIREMLSEAQAQALRAGALLEEVRSLIRKGGTYEQTEVDLNDVVRDVAGLLRPESERRGVRLAVDLAETPVVTWVNRVQIQQVVINLVQNGLEALRLADGDRWLRIETVATPPHVEVRVWDGGPGISKEAASQMFDVFFTTRADGLGMGLAISRSIVEAYEGSLRGENHAEGGAIFTVSLPAARRSGETPSL